MDANSFIPISITTDERTQCKYSFVEEEWEGMSSLGSNSYTTEHAMLIQLPNPNHGQSLGIEFSEEFNIYIKCQDVNGNRAPLDPEFYVIDMCANQGDDVTPPLILATTPESNSLVSFLSIRVPYICQVTFILFSIIRSQNFINSLKVTWEISESSLNIK